MHDERRAQRAQQIEHVPGAAGGDPFAAWTERLHEQLDLARLTVDPIERVRPAQEGIERGAWPHVDELAGAGLRRDLRRRDPHDRAERADLRGLQDSARLEDHRGVPTAKV